jgi:hypothetical protein
MKIKECLDKETVENLVLSHGTWKHLFYRCYAKKSPDYKNYGGRGIDVCHQWHGESGFYEFIKDIGLRPSKEHSLDRIDVNKGYYPDNVKWATNIEQANNRRNTKRYLLDGENLTISEISRKLNIPYKRLWKANKLYGSPLEHKKLDPNNGKYFYDGLYRSMSEIAKMVNLKPSTLMRRIRTGLDFDFAIATPLSSGVNLKERSKWS